LSLKGSSYRAEIEILGSIDGELTNYPVNITIPYTEGKMRTDFQDIRFTDNSGITELDYHLLEVAEEYYAVFVVKIPYIPENPYTTRIYMYSGNPEATTTSNPENVYTFYDDFSGDLSKWTSTPPGWSIENGKLKSTSTGTIYAIISGVSDLIFSCTIKTETDYGVRRLRVSNSNDLTYNTLWIRFDEDVIQQIRTGESTGGTVFYYLNSDISYRFELKKLYWDWYAYVNGSLINTKTYWSLFTPYYIGLSNETDYTTYYSDVIVRKTTRNDISDVTIGEFQSLKSQLTLSLPSPEIKISSQIILSKALPLKLKIKKPAVSTYDIAPFPLELELEQPPLSVNTEINIDFNDIRTISRAFIPLPRKYVKNYFKTVTEILNPQKRRFKTIACINPFKTHFKTIARIASSTKNYIKTKARILPNNIQNLYETQQYFKTTTNIEGIQTYHAKTVAFIGSYRKRIELYGTTMKRESEVLTTHIDRASNIIIGDEFYVD